MKSMSHLMMGVVLAGIACLWDEETRLVESQRFPDAIELITGKFPRHSNLYYQWRIADRQSTPEANRTPNDYDDIAVAYDKLGQHDQAIATIQSKIARWPDRGRYESEANLGTFLIHAGRFAEGLKHINRAIEINPNAHFGREVYQKLLVEYVVRQRMFHNNLPLASGEANQPSNFASFVVEYHDPKTEKQYRQAIDQAARGIMGMMRFGQHDSPILLEALGDLFAAYPEADEALKRIAALAYLRASLAVPDLSAQSAYSNKALRVVGMKTGWEISEYQSQLQEAMAAAQELESQIIQDEFDWHAAGLNLDRQFRWKYYSWSLPSLTIILTSCSVAVGLVITMIWLRKRKIDQRVATAGNTTENHLPITASGA